MGATEGSIRQHHYKSYYYNFHRFRWKKCQIFSISSEAEGMETNKTSQRNHHSCHKKSVGGDKFKRLRFRREVAAESLVTTFASFALMILTFLLLTSNRAVHCQDGKLTVTTEALNFQDSSGQPSKSVEIKNCFSFERKKSWFRAIMYKNTTASINVDLSKMDQSVLECLKGN